MRYLALLLLLVACAKPGLVPNVTRPDTRWVEGVVLDSSAMRKTLQTYQTAYPNEAAMCYYGSVRDTVFEGDSSRLVWADRAIPAAQDSASELHVWFPRGMLSGCIIKGGLVGIGHAHQISTGYCSHSPDDARVLFENPRALFSLVFCINGSAEVMFQDGRRIPDSWLKALKQ